MVRFWLTIACIVIMTPIGFFLVMRKKFDRHPYPIMGWAILAQANQYYNQISVKLYFSLTIYKLWIPPL